MELLEIINPEHASEEEASNYPLRVAARAVVLDSEGNVALLHVTRDHYYKLPGGGIETGEDHTTALQRECREEIGCEVQVADEVGIIVENRKFCHLKQISYCYFTQLLGAKGAPSFMADEVEAGFEAMWVPYETALKLLSNNQATGLEGRSYIVPRDTIFLKAAKDLVIK